VQLAVRTTNLVLAVYWLALFAGTHVPLPPELVDLPGGDKTLHFLAYLGLSLLLAAALARTWGGLAPSHYVGMLAGLALYGVLDELLQIPVNRSADVADWLADVAGAATGLAAFAAVGAVWRSAAARAAARTPELVEAEPATSATVDP
jgi:VanZ family protein